MRWLLPFVAGCASFDIAPGERPVIPPNEGVLAIGIEIPFPPSTGVPLD